MRAKLVFGLCFVVDKNTVVCIEKKEGEWEIK